MASTCKLSKSGVVLLLDSFAFLCVAVHASSHTHRIGRYMGSCSYKHSATRVSFSIVSRFITKSFFLKLDRNYACLYRREQLSRLMQRGFPGSNEDGAQQRCPHGLCALSEGHGGRIPELCIRNHHLFDSPYGGHPALPAARGNAPSRAIRQRTSSDFTRGRAGDIYQFFNAPLPVTSDSARPMRAV